MQFLLKHAFLGHIAAIARVQME